MFTDIEGAADCLKASPETIRELAASGEIPGVKIGRAWVFVVEDLVEWVRGQIRIKHAKPNCPTPLVPRAKRRRRKLPTLINAN